MPTVSMRGKILAFMGVAELFIFGFILGLLYVGKMSPPFFGKINPSLPLSIVCGLWGGLIVVISLASVLMLCRSYAVRGAQGGAQSSASAQGVSKSQLWSSYVVCTASTLAIKIMSVVSGFAVALGCLAVALLGVREALHLSMAASISIVVAGILGMLFSVGVLPALALNFAAADHYGEPLDALVCDGLVGAMVLSAPVSSVIAFTTQLCPTPCERC